MKSQMTYVSLMSPFYRAAARIGIVNLERELWYAASRGYSQTVKAILAAGADVHSAEDYALRVAVNFRHTDTVRALLEAGAEVHFDDDTAFWLVANNRDVATARVLDEFDDHGERKIGDFDDGGIYVGRSEDGRPLHAALADEPGYLTYEGALVAAKRLKAEHPTAHVPTPDELHQLFVNRDTGHLRGTFNTSGSYPAGVYRSCAPNDERIARIQWFDDDGYQSYINSYHPLPVRLVW